MSELKPCPFCGSEAKLYSVGLTKKKLYAIVCTKCKVQYPFIFADEDMAIETWNKRAEEIGVPIYDKETRHENCTVQILENTETGRISVRWWRNETNT